MIAYWRGTCGGDTCLNSVMTISYFGAIFLSASQPVALCYCYQHLVGICGHMKKVQEQNGTTGFAITFLI